MVDINPNIFIFVVTLNVSEQNTPIKSKNFHIILNENNCICCLQQTSLKNKDTKNVKVKEQDENPMQI